MEFSEILARIDKQLESGKRLRDYVNEVDAGNGVWTLGSEVAEVRPSTATGVLLRLASKGKVVVERTFAATEMSVPKIAGAITEHLTGYAA
jgi:hypothetical protein